MWEFHLFYLKRIVWVLIMFIFVAFILHGVVSHERALFLSVYKFSCSLYISKQPYTKYCFSFSLFIKYFYPGWNLESVGIHIKLLAFSSNACAYAQLHLNVSLKDTVLDDTFISGAPPPPPEISLLTHWMSFLVSKQISILVLSLSLQFGKGFVYTAASGFPCKLFGL